MLIADKNFKIDKSKSSVVTIGKFDGIHKGHKLIFDRVFRESGDELEAVVVSFANHPSGLLTEKPVKCLMTEEEKINSLTEYGFDVYCRMIFDETLKNTSAEDFFAGYIRDNLNASVLVVGDDFRFGKDRAGDVILLEKLCRKNGIKLVVVDRLLYDGDPVSSSRIKTCLNKGKIDSANDMLGYAYGFKGTVKSGNKIGRTIGFPTVNVYPEDDKFVPLFGVYRTYVTVNDRICKGITNIGVKPTVSEDNAVVIETNILDFDDDVYGKTVSVKLESFVRGEKCFASLDLLKEQIKIDKKSWTNH